MIKNIIFDVGMVLVNWDPHAAFQELGFDEKTEGGGWKCNCLL